MRCSNNQRQLPSKVTKLLIFQHVLSKTRRDTAKERCKAFCSQASRKRGAPCLKDPVACGKGPKLSARTGSTIDPFTAKLPHHAHESGSQPRRIEAKPGSTFNSEGQPKPAATAIHLLKSAKAPGVAPPSCPSPDAPRHTLPAQASTFWASSAWSQTARSSSAFFTAPRLSDSPCHSP